MEIPGENKSVLYALLYHKQTVTYSPDCLVVIATDRMGVNAALEEGEH